jgi:flavodoxin
MIQIIYASTMGHTELVVEKISELLTSVGIENELHKAEVTDYSVIQNNSKFIFATSTWEHGVMNPYFDKIFDQLTQERDLSSKIAAFVGTGSVKYEIYFFCEGAKMLRKAWIDGQGREYVGPIFLDGLPYDKLDTLVTNWTNKLIEKINETE